MHLPSFAQLVAATRHAAQPCVSLFLPTHQSGRETRQGPARLKTMLRDARHDAGEAGIDEKALTRVLAPATALVDDHEFWQHQRQGLALLLAPDVQQILRVPFELPELVVVGTRLHIAPLLPLHDSSEFRLLCLSPNRVRVFACDAWGQREEELEDLPPDLATAMARDATEPTLQQHTYEVPHAQRVMYHGHGGTGKGDRDEADLRRFFRLVDEALDQGGGQQAPLVVAGLAENTARFRQVTRRPDHVAATIAANPDDADVDDLHDEARRLLAPRREARRQRAIDDHLRLAGTGLTCKAPDQIVQAARNGRVRDLFVVPGHHAWGSITDDDLRTAELHATRRPGDVDLLDVAVADTIAQGGSVHRADPELMGSAAAATLRY